MHSDHWRAEVDLVLNTMEMNASTNSSLILWFCDEENISCFEDAPYFTTTNFQLVAYKSLLASLLSPCCHRPPYLSQGLALFRKGLSLPLSLYEIYTHGCRMHVDGVSLKVNKKLKYSLISQKKCIICALQKHSMSSSKCILLEQIFPYLNIIYWTFCFSN